MAPSIIGEDLVVNGTLSSPGDIQVDGRIEGSVQCASLVVGDKAVIHGDVFAQNIAVRGRIEGNVRGNMVQLSTSCHIEGDIYQRALAVEPGAHFDGNCRHTQNPLDGDAIPSAVAAQARKPADQLDRENTPLAVTQLRPEGPAAGIR